MQSPAQIVEIATAYWHSATLIASIQLRLPTHLSGESKTVTELARLAGCDETALLALLEGLCSLNIIERQGERFSNTPNTEVFLVEGKPAFMGAALLYNADVYPKWASLSETIKNGKPVHDPEEYLGDRKNQTRNFVYGMHHRALSVGRAVVDAIDLTNRKRLCDIGGGPGTYSALLANQYPQLHATVMDLPAVADIATQIVKTVHADGRVDCVPFDYYADHIQNRYDAMLISGVLHREQIAGVETLLSKACQALEPGGVLYISDVMVNDERTGPIFATMFSINMRVLAHNGRAHSVKEQSEILARFGLETVSVVTLPSPIHYTIIKAEKPL